MDGAPGGHGGAGDEHVGITEKEIMGAILLLEGPNLLSIVFKQFLFETFAGGFDTFVESMYVCTCTSVF